MEVQLLLEINALGVDWDGGAAGLMLQSHVKRARLLFESHTVVLDLGSDDGGGRSMGDGNFLGRAGPCWGGGEERGSPTAASLVVGWGSGARRRWWSAGREGHGWWVAQSLREWWAAQSSRGEEAARSWSRSPLGKNEGEECGPPCCFFARGG